MVCENCGKEVPEGDKFCTQCGWKVPVEEAKTEEPAAEEVKAEEPQAEETKTEEPVAEEVKAEEPQAEETKIEEAAAEEVKAEEPQAEEAKTGELPPSPTNPPEPEKKKFNKKIAIIIGSAAALMLVLIVANWATLTNTMKRTFSSPEKYYQWVEKNTVKDAAASAASIYSSYLLETLKVYDTGSSAELTLELGEAGQDMLSLAGLAGMDLSWFESATISYEGYSKDNVVQNSIGLGLGRDKLLTLDSIIDIEGENAYLAIPELSKSYIGVEMDDLSDYSYYLDDSSDGVEYMDVLKTICERLPEEKQVQKLLAKYFDIALGCVEDVEMKKGKTLRAEGITQTCTELEVTIDADTVEDVLKAVLEEMEDDGDIKEIIIRLCDELAKQDMDGLEDIDSEEVYEAFRDACKEARKDAKYAVDSDMELVMTLYVDKKGNVRGRTVEYDDGWDSFKLEVANPHKGSKFGYKASADVDGQEFAVTGSGKDSNGTINGDFSVKYNGAGIVDITAKKFDTDSLKKGCLNGEFTVKASSGISRALGMASTASFLSDMVLSIDVSMSSSSNKLIVSLTEDGDNWGSVTLAASRKSGKRASVPSEKKTIFVEDEDDFEDYWDTIEWDSFLKKLDKTALPSDVVDYVEDIADMDADEVMEELEYLMWDLMYYMY
ncbi:MAG: zinc-ribbon domain-containing protein [Acetatifactor sp.]